MQVDLKQVALAVQRVPFPRVRAPRAIEQNLK